MDNNKLIKKIDTTFNIMLKHYDEILWEVNKNKRQIISNIIREISKLLNINYKNLISFKFVKVSLFKENIEKIKEIIINHTSIIEVNFDVSVIFHDETEMKLYDIIIKYLRQILNQVNFTIVNHKEYLFIKNLD
jgi:hypothetical protein